MSSPAKDNALLSSEGLSDAAIAIATMEAEVCKMVFFENFVFMILF